MKMMKKWSSHTEHTKNEEGIFIYLAEKNAKSKSLRPFGTEGFWAEVFIRPQYFSRPDKVKNPAHRAGFKT
jgi:hypothetical protein